MAEGPQIIFEPDMSKVAKAIDDIEAKARSNPVELSVGAGGGAPGARGSGTPRATSVLQAADRQYNAAIGLAIAEAGGSAVQRANVYAAAAASYIADDPNSIHATRYTALAIRERNRAVAQADRGDARARAAADREIGQYERNFDSGINALLGQEIRAGRRDGGGNGPNGPNGPRNRTPGDDDGDRGNRWLRYAAIGYAIRAIGHTGAGLLQASRSYNVSADLTGNDQRGETEATLAYRDAVASSGGFVGQAVAYLQDPTGTGEAGIRAALAASGAQDVRTRGMRTGQDIARQLSGELNVASQISPYRRAIAQVDAATAEKVSQIRTAKEAQGANELAVYNAGVAQRKADRERNIQRTLEASRVTASVSASDLAFNPGNGAYRQTKTREQAEAEVDALNNREDATARAALGKGAARFDKDVDEANRVGAIQRTILYRDEYYRLQGVNSALTARDDASRYLAGNRPQEARIAGLAGQGRAEIIEGLQRGESWQTIGRIFLSNTLAIASQRAQDARELSLDTATLAGRTGVSNAVLARQPLEARIRSVEAARDDRIRRDPRATPGSDLRTAYEEEARAEIATIGQHDADVKRYRRQELTGEREALEFELDFRPGAARGRREATRARIEARQLREQEGDPDAARQVLENAILSQEVRKKQILNAVDATEIDINTTALNGPRAGEDIPGLLRALNDNITGLRGDLNNGAAATTTP